jgi:hypothetical protein
MDEAGRDVEDKAATIAAKQVSARLTRITGGSTSGRGMSYQSFSRAGRSNRGRFV